MIATFRETWTSLRNLEYGKDIITKTVGQAFWYWFKYILVTAGIMLVLAIAALTFFTPQLPTLAEKALPDMAVEIKDGKLSTDSTQPVMWDLDAGFKVIIDTQGQEADADNFDNGMLFLQDKLIVKDNTQIQVFNFSEIEEDISLDKPTVINWLKDNKINLLGIGLAVIIIASIFFLGIFVAFRWVTFLIGAVFLLVFAGISKRKIKFIDSLKLVIYAAVPAFLASVIHPVLSLAVWIFFACIWTYKLPKSS